MSSSNPISTRLRTAREERRISLSELSISTSIRLHVLEAIDKGRLDDLPQVYMRSFLRKYADAVGIAESEISDLLAALPEKQTVGSVAPVKQSNQDTSRPNKARFDDVDYPPPQRESVSHMDFSSEFSLRTSPNSKYRKYLFSGLGIASVSALVYFLIWGKNDQLISDKHPAIQEQTIDSMSQNKGDDSNSKNGGLLSYFGSGSLSSDSLALEAVATDSAWISVTTDGKDSENRILTPGSSFKWSAEKTFLVSVGNAGGITLFRNGQELPLLGKKGETVRSIRVTRTEFVTSSSPWRSQRDTTARRRPSIKVSTAPETTTQKTTTPQAEPVKPVLQNQTETPPPKKVVEPARANTPPKKPVIVAPKPLPETNPNPLRTDRIPDTKKPPVIPIKPPSTKATIATQTPLPATKKPLVSNSVTTKTTTPLKKPASSASTATTVPQATTLPTPQIKPKPFIKKPATPAQIEAIAAKKRRDELIRQAQKSAKTITPVPMKASPPPPKLEKLPD